MPLDGQLGDEAWLNSVRLPMFQVFASLAQLAVHVRSRQDRTLLAR